MTGARLLVFPRVIIQDFFYPLFFLYCVTLHADQLGFNLFGFQIRVNNCIALVLFAYLLARYRNELFKIDRSLVYSLGLLLISILLSFLFSPYKTRCFFFLGFFGLTTLCYVLLPYWLMIRLDADLLMKIYLVSYLVVGAYALCQLLCCFIGIHDPFVYQLISGTLYRPNALAYEPSFYALYFTPFMVIVNLHYLLNKKGPLWIFSCIKGWHVALVNILFLVSTSTSCYFAYASFALILVVLSLFPFIRFHFPSLLRKGMKFVLGAALFSGLLLIVFRRVMTLFFLKFFYAGFSHHSIVERWSGILNAVTLFLKRPLLGIGMGAYPPYMMSVYLQENTDYIFNYQERLLPFTENPTKLFEPSNVFTEVLASLGLLGLIALLSFGIVLVVRGVKVIQRVKSKETKERLFALLVSVLVTALVLQINQGFFRTYIWAHYTLVFAYFTKMYKLIPFIKMQ